MGLLRVGSVTVPPSVGRGAPPRPRSPHRTRLRVCPEHDGGATVRRWTGDRWRRLAARRALVWPLVPGLMAGTLAIDMSRRRTTGRRCPARSSWLSFLAVMLAPYVVGLLLTLRVPGHGAGWSFLRPRDQHRVERLRRGVRAGAPSAASSTCPAAR